MFRNYEDLSDHLRHAIGRHRGRHGFGHGFRGFGGGFMGGDGFPSGRKLGAEELQLILLALLAEQPAHGYELIRILEERSGGFYAPSPGMIYPALTYLDEIGHAGATQEGNRKLYTITDAGRAYLAERRDHADMILDALTRIGGRMSQVREAFAGLDEGDPQANDNLHKARHALKHALMGKRGCAPDEARRIAEILARATAEIVGTRNQARSQETL
jgi:DNA-binding PadR family transcriptional regulator